jgi:hypothetical protein
MDDDDEEFIFLDDDFDVNNPSEETYRSVRQFYNNQQNAVGELMSIATRKKDWPRRKYINFRARSLHKSSHQMGHYIRKNA